MNRPLYELKLRVGILKSVSEVLREQCVAIARDKSPSASINLAHRSTACWEWTPTRLRKQRGGCR